MSLAAMTLAPVSLAVSSAPRALWYLTRGTGLVSLLVLSAVVVLGVLTSGAWETRRWPRFASQVLHRNLSLFCLALIAVHVTTTVVDGYAPIGFLDALVPFHSPYRSLWLGLGALALDLLLAVALTSAVRHRLGYRSWKAVHWLAYASWPVAVLHGLGTGTDAAARAGMVVDGVCLAAVTLAVAWRFQRPWGVPRPSRWSPGGAAAVRLARQSPKREEAA